MVRMVRIQKFYIFCFQSSEIQLKTTKTQLQLRQLPRATIVPQKNYMTQITCLNLIAIEFLWFSAEFPSFGNKIYKTFEFEPFGPWVFDSETLQKKIIK